VLVHEADDAQPVAPRLPHLAHEQLGAHDAQLAADEHDVALGVAERRQRRGARIALEHGAVALQLAGEEKAEVQIAVHDEAGVRRRHARQPVLLRRLLLRQRC
jgi:hypothetical protein